MRRAMVLAAAAISLTAGVVHGAAANPLANDNPWVCVGQMVIDRGVCLYDAPRPRDVPTPEIPDLGDFGPW